MAPGWLRLVTLGASLAHDDFNGIINDFPKGKVDQWVIADFWAIDTSVKVEVDTGNHARYDGYRIGFYMEPSDRF